jgi:hypothetical protein
MRARQHVDLRDSTRLSIRLNWQGVAPPQKHLPAAHSLVWSVVGAAAVIVHPQIPRIPTRSPDDVQTPPSLFDNAPDLLRGPPARSI